MRAPLGGQPRSELWHSIYMSAVLRQLAVVPETKVSSDSEEESTRKGGIHSSMWTSPFHPFDLPVYEVLGIGSRYCSEREQARRIEWLQAKPPPSSYPLLLGSVVFVRLELHPSNAKLELLPSRVLWFNVTHERRPRHTATFGRRANYGDRIHKGGIDISIQI
ncbi:hypothetical protein EVAR_81867_1 [Eumeta japonica]|uniref:Uncharacterized protein n=1 Tax=Eumeta variegata TaxID=151549 RepID=A0A4C1UXF9_EUMVA|nr:hypothetical protein EVAR_81867_1 [Eumeta japonica]